MSDSEQQGEQAVDSKSGHRGRILFSPFITLVCLLLCLSGIVVLLWNALSGEALRESSTASRDLERLSDRLLSIEARFSELSVLEQWVFSLWGEAGDNHEQLRSWYQEMLEPERDPLDQLYFGILLGENSFKEDLGMLTKQWNANGQPDLVLRQLIDVVYFEKPLRRQDYDVLQARLAEEVPASWFYFQLAKRLARQSDDIALEEQFSQQFRQLTDPYVDKARALIFFEMTVVGVGVLCLLSLRRGRGVTSNVVSVSKESARTSLWSFHEGIAILVRGGALSIVIIVFMGLLPHGVEWLRDYGSLVLYLPTVVLMAYFLRRYKGQTLVEGLGCQLSITQIRSFLQILAVVLALGLIGDWLIMFGGRAVEGSVHWTEWFIPQLIWGNQVELLKTTIEFIVIAPIFEEIIFRGILFPTLRARFNLPTSIIGSALVFAVAHGYGIIAFLSVFWSGLLWAWMYARTGNIIPSIAAHAVNNGLVVYSVVVIFR